MKKAAFFLFGIILLTSSCTTAQNPYQQKIDTATALSTQFLKDQQIPGMSISVSHKGKMIWSKGFGYADVKAAKKVIPNTTQFRVASISKTLT
ncbi:MAG: serine hydrolase, partial [Flavobacteriaceae bacterium]|nr:serine hydrolase [Flavobacteriaceae bacterium]